MGLKGGILSQLCTCVFLESKFWAISSDRVGRISWGRCKLGVAVAQDHRGGYPPPG